MATDPFPAGPRNLPRASRRLIAGIILILMALLYGSTLLATGASGPIRGWLHVNAQIAGWGMVLVPIFLLYSGLLLIRDYTIGAPGSQVRIVLIQIAGGLLLFTGILGLTHILFMEQHPAGEFYVNPAFSTAENPQGMWENAVACPTDPGAYLDAGWIIQTAYWRSTDAAACGHGGGYLGAFIQMGLTGAFGEKTAQLITILMIGLGAGLTISARIAQRRAIMFGTP